MDTRDNQFQDALNELYMSLTKVMRLAGCDMNAEQQLQYVVSALSGFTQNGTISMTKSVSPPLTLVEEVENVSSSATTQQSLQQFSIRETKYAQSPDQRNSDDKWAFKNRELEENSDDNLYYTVGIIDDKEAVFELNENAIQELNDKPWIAPNGVVLQSGSSIHERFDCIQKGKLERDGKYWVVLEPCKIEWQ